MEYILQKMKNKLNILEFELYKFVITSGTIIDLGWIDDESFCIWVKYSSIGEVKNELEKIFGRDLFYEDGCPACMQEDSLCIYLSKLVGQYVELDEMFS